MTGYSAVTGIILAGGQGKRMGADKGLVHFAGKPLVQYAIDLLMPFCGRILISSNNPMYDHFGFKVVRDEFSKAGPMAGIASCLRTSETDGNLVVSCDMPLLEPVVVQTILKNVGDSVFCVPSDGMGRIEPLCAYYSRQSLNLIISRINSKSYRLTDLFKDAEVRFVFPDDYPLKFKSEWFTNVNSPGDLQ